MNIYSAIAETGRNLDFRRTSRNIRGRQLGDESRLIWDKDLDNYRWAREYTVCGKVSTKGIVAHTVTASGKWCRIWTLKDYDKPNQGWDCPIEAVYLESVQAGVMSWAALPMLLYEKQFGIHRTRAELMRLMHHEDKNRYARIRELEERRLEQRLRR